MTQKTCTNEAHPVATDGPVVRETAKAIYIALTCPTCGLVQSVRRIKKEGAK